MKLSTKRLSPRGDLAISSTEGRKVRFGATDSKFTDSSLVMMEANGWNFQVAKHSNWSGDLVSIPSAFWKAQGGRMDKEEWEITKDAPLEQKERQLFWMSRAFGAGILSLDCISGKLELTSEEKPHSTDRSLKPTPPGHFWQTSDFHFLSEI